MNSQLSLFVWGIQGSPSVLFMVARALVTMGSEEEEEVIFSARTVSIAQMW